MNKQKNLKQIPNWIKFILLSLLFLTVFIPVNYYFNPQLKNQVIMVTDSNGIPIENQTITIKPFYNVSSISLPFAKTDNFGNADFNSIQSGSYYVAVFSSSGNQEYSGVFNTSWSLWPIYLKN